MLCSCDRAIANGRIRDIDTREAERAPGVLAVMMHRNAPRLKEPGQGVEGGFIEEKLLPLQSDRVHYAGQHIAVVIADTLEQAEHAAALVRVAYDEQQPATELGRELSMNGVAAAITNAVFHATGKRIRDLPITPDKLL